MQTFKPSEAESAKLKALAKQLKEANAALSAAKKAADAIKKQVADWLKEKRGLDIETLSIGEMVLIEEAFMLEIGKMTKFDEDGFSIAQPELHAKWMKDLLVKKFKPLG